MHRKFSLLVAAGLLAVSKAPAAPPQSASPEAPTRAVVASSAPAGPAATAPSPDHLPRGWTECCLSGRGHLESDQAFPHFIGPISNPVLSKDPRALTEARLFYIHNKIDPKHILGSGSIDSYHMQVRVALTERLSFIADKDGYAHIRPQGGSTQDGWLNIAAGLKYSLIRDVENQFLWTAGLMFEPQTGEASVFQSHGDGLFTLFTTAGKEFGDKAHLLGTFGYQFPADRKANSSFFYTSLHLDKQLFGWLYPLVELNWFHWTAGGDRGLPPSLGEGDGLINLGTSRVSGNDLVTAAVGLKAQLSEHAELGAAWEFPISNRHDLLNNRLLVELILRY